MKYSSSRRAHNPTSVIAMTNRNVGIGEHSNRFGIMPTNTFWLLPAWVPRNHFNAM